MASETLTAEEIENLTPTTVDHVDYTKMVDHEMLVALGSDARKWAAAFCQYAAKNGFDPKDEVDEDWLAGWFANAIEYSYDIRTGNGPVILPDGSAFFVAEVQ